MAYDSLKPIFILAFVKMRYLLTLLLSLVVSLGWAQTPQTPVTTAPAKTEATTAPAAPAGPAAAPAAGDPAAKPAVRKNPNAAGAPRRVSPVYKGKRQREKARGYRVQVYSGAGNTASKEAAREMAATVRAKFPEISVYCHFKSPRWVCRIGDFATKEAAQRYLTKVKKAKLSPEASIVIDDVFLAK